MNRPTNTCGCGAEFEQSAQNVTVNCPACRKRNRKSKQQQSKTVVCNCGKTVIVDGFGHSTNQTCPREC